MRRAAGAIVSRRVIEAWYEVAHLGGVDRLRRRRRRREDAETVERLERRQHARSIRGAGLVCISCSTAVADARSECRNPPQHFDEQPGQRQVGPIGVGRYVEEYDLALAEIALSDQRRAVLQARPHVHVGTKHRRIGEHLAADRDLRRYRRSGEETCILDRRQLLRRRPRQGAAKGAAADAQRYGQQLVAAVLEPRAGKADEHAALLHPLLDVLCRFARKRADVGEHEHAGVLRQRLLNAGGEIGSLRLDQLGVRVERLLDVIQRREERLRLFEVLARDQRHAMPLRARVDEADGAGRALAGDLHPANLIAQLERQFEGYGGRRSPVGNLERRFGKALPARRDGVHEAATRPAMRAQHARLEFAALADARGDAERLGRAPILDDGEGAALRQLAQLGGDVGRLAVVVDVIAQPNDAGALRAGQCSFEGADGSEPVGCKWLRIERCGCGAGFGRRLDARGGNFGRARRRHDDDGPALALGFGDDPINHACALVPTRGGRPTVVDDDGHRARAVECGLARRVQHRLGEREDQERSGKKADQRQPPRRRGGRLLLVLQPNEDARRREGDLVRARRHGAQQPIDDR